MLCLCFNVNNLETVLILTDGYAWSINNRRAKDAEWVDTQALPRPIGLWRVDVNKKKYTWSVP